jgi:hypothetical protein
VELLGDEDLVWAAIRDHEAPPIAPKRRAFLRFVENVNRAANDIGPANVADAKAAGWSDEAPYDAITVWPSSTSTTAVDAPASGTGE